MQGRIDENRGCHVKYCCPPTMQPYIIMLLSNVHHCLSGNPYHSPDEENKLTMMVWENHVVIAKEKQFTHGVAPDVLNFVTCRTRLTDCMA